MSLTWIVVLVALALVGLFLVLFKRPWELGDRENPLASGKGGAGNQLSDEFKWDPADIPASFASVLRSVERAAETARDWYWKNKRAKARASRFIRASAVVLGALAGLVPVGLELLRHFYDGPSSTPPWWVTGLWASVLIGLATALVGLDNAFGFSASWTRYVLAATEITRLLAEFRMDWIALMSTIPGNQAPTAQQIDAILQRARTFRIAVESVVVQETKDWATAFQNNLAELEKDLKAQLDSLISQSQARLKELDAAAQPASLEIAVPNADKAQDATFLVSLEDATGRMLVSDEKVVHNRTWIGLNMRPGQYKITVTANMAAAGAAAIMRSASKAVVVKPGEPLKDELPLPE